jgi:hypothetical protein
MKQVKLTAADIDNLRKSVPSQRTPQAFHHEEIQVDAVSIGLVRPQQSADPRTNTYSIGFRCGDSEYLIIVRPTVHQMPSITLDIIRPVAGSQHQSDIDSYTVLNDTVTTLKGRLSGVSREQIVSTTGDVATAHLDMQELLAHLKVE